MKHILTIIFMLSLFASIHISPAFAAGLSVRLDEPKSPTNLQDISLGFVALDIPGRTVIVKCFKKGPTDGAYTQFDSTKNLISGGNNGICAVTSSIVNQQGTYQFYVTAEAGSDTQTSQIVSVDYNTSGPGTPVSYSKNKSSSCEYTIKFKTADDSGKTSRVEIYRSETTTIGLDAGSRVGTVYVGSNEEKTFVNGIPDCGKTYYYVIRAYDASGNGSGTIGDSVVTTTTTSTTSSSSSSTSGTAGSTDSQSLTGGGAIAVDDQEGIIGKDTTQAGEEEDEQVEETSEGTEEESAVQTSSEEVLGAETEDKPFFLIAWIIAFIEWIKSFF